MVTVLVQLLCHRNVTKIRLVKRTIVCAEIEDSDAW